MKVENREPKRVEIPVGESFRFADGECYRFVAGDGCRDCAFYSRRSFSPFGAAGKVKTNCLATARTVATGEPIYPCSSLSRNDKIDGCFKCANTPRRVRDFIESETFARLWRRFAWTFALAAAALAVALAFAASASGADYSPRFIETFEDVHRATCRVVCVDSTGRGAMGTGTVVGYDETDDAYEVLTNYHVVQGHSFASLHFFGDGRRVEIDKVPVVATYYDEKLPIDAAILKVPRSEALARYDPPVAPLAPAGYKPKEGAYIWSAGCSEGRWAAAWKGGVESYYGNTAQFYPAPKGGQSGSAIIEMTSDGLFVVGILTWRVGAEETTSEENMRGGAIPIAKLYEAASGRRATGEIDSIPPNAKFCASPVRYHLIYFYSKDCDGCAKATPIINCLYASGYDITGVDLDAKEGVAFAERFGVRTVPSFLMTRQLTAAEHADETKSTALELWFGPDDLEKRVRNSFARVARLGVPNVAAYEAERATAPTYSLVPAPAASVPIPTQTAPTAPQTPPTDAETSYPVTAATSPAYFQNVAFSTEDAAAPLDVLAATVDASETSAPISERDPATDAPELGEIAPVSRGSADAERLLDRYRDGFRGGNMRPQRPDRDEDPAPSSGPIVGAIERAAQNAIDRIANDATATINAKIEDFEEAARRRVAETAGKIAFWGALIAGGWYWLVRAAVAAFGAAVKILTRLRLEPENAEENANSKG